MADLRTNYQDDVLDASKNTARVYDLVDSKGNVVLAGVHLEDKTVYTTEGDDYGAADINEQNEKINGLNADLSELPNRIEVGSIDNITIAGALEFTVTFENPFTAPPKVFLSLIDNSSKGTPILRVRTITTTGFVCRMYTEQQLTNCSIDWLAVI